MFLRRGFGFVRGLRHFASGHRNVVTGQESLGLIFMDFHCDVVSWRISTIPHVTRCPSFIASSPSGEHLCAPRKPHQAMGVLLEGGASEPSIAGVPGRSEDERRDRGRARRLRPRHARAHDRRGCRRGPDRHLRHRRRREPARSTSPPLAALVMAGAGARVAKHGNRSISELQPAARTCWKRWACASP